MRSYDGVSHAVGKLWLTVDTGLGAASNALALILAARILSPAELSNFSIVLLIATSAVSLQRATLLTPGLATQRTLGRSSVPLRWILFVSLPVGLITAAAALLGVPGQEAWPTAAAASQLSIFMLTADVARAYLLNLNSASKATIADGALLLGMIGLLVVTPLVIPDPSAVALLLGYDGALLLGTCIMIAFAARARRRDMRPQMSLLATWRLGKWSGADNLLSAIASIVPMVVTTSLLSATLAGEYRLMQTAAGPLNVLTTAITASMGIDSWKLVDAAGLTRLRQQVRKLTLGLALFTMVYIIIAEIVIIWAANLSSTSVLRVALICAIVGVLNSLRTPTQAAALALGGQRFGFFIRVFVVFAAAALTLLAVRTSLLPWNDPIGWIAIVASLANLAGWRFAYTQSARSARVIHEGAL